LEYTFKLVHVLFVVIVGRILHDRDMNDKPLFCVKNTIDIMTTLPNRLASCSEALFSREFTSFF